VNACTTIVGLTIPVPRNAVPYTSYRETPAWDLEALTRTEPGTVVDVDLDVATDLSTELEVPAEEITESTRLREDLDADSLDLYELVMELEDTYGITVSEEEAAGIETVQQAVEFVAGRLGVTT